jgi:hypothetical protein
VSFFFLLRYRTYDTFKQIYIKKGFVFYFILLIIYFNRKWSPSGKVYKLLKNLYLFIRLYSLLLDLGRFFIFLIPTQSAGLLGGGISPSQGLYLHTEQHKHKINARRYPCVEWDSNPRSPSLSERRQFMP